MVRLQIVLDPAEADALAAWAESELRDPRDQIRLVLRRELERRGLLEANREMPIGQGEATQADHYRVLPSSPETATRGRKIRGTGHE
jgi:hypothetical protein